jgi:predicted glycogen debranching enzyme
MFSPEIKFSWNKENNLTPLISKEWLVTNGLGGYSSGTILGVSTRRYHGLFIPNLPAPRGRTMMIPRMDEEVIVNDKRAVLSGAEFSDGKVESEAHKYLQEFKLEWQIPTWLYEIDGHVIQKKIVMPYGNNTVYTQYHLLSDAPVKLQIRPFISCRMHDGALGHAANWPFTLTISRGQFEVHPFESAPVLRMRVLPAGGTFVSEDKTSQDVLYRVEKERGQDFLENLYSPGYFRLELKPDKPVSFVASTESWEILQCEASSILEAEQKRREKLLSLAPKPAQSGLMAHLVLASDQFIVLPWSRAEETMLTRASGERIRTVIAGYHWFTDWGRDTMISLEGLALCTGRYYEAKAILQTFAHYVKDGLIPNLFPEGQRSALYHTVDATLWYFHAIDRYYQHTQDKETLEHLYPTMKSIIDHYSKGTHFGIFMDPRDGLVKAAAEGYQLTWMDAKVDEWVVTPRRGKPVEIQALWYNALKLMTAWARDLGESGEEYRLMSKRVFDSFNARFWFESGKHLYDVIDGEKGNDASLRPNQIFTMALRYSVLDRSYWKPVLDAVTKKLLTPYGLRTLDAGNKNYHSRYEGDRWARDAAYHQGMVWAWLIGPYLNAWIRVYRDKKEAVKMLDGFKEHLNDAGVGSISEIFDGDSPFTPRGCIAQAWSVAEVLRSLLMLEEPLQTITHTQRKEDTDENIKRRSFPGREN